MSLHSPLTQWPQAMRRLASKLFGSPPLSERTAHLSVVTPPPLPPEQLAYTLWTAYPERPAQLLPWLLEQFQQWQPEGQCLLYHWRTDHYQCVARQGHCYQSPAPFQPSLKHLKSWAALHDYSCYVSPDDPDGTPLWVWLFNRVDGATASRLEQWTQITQPILSHWLTHQPTFQPDANPDLLPLMAQLLRQPLQPEQVLAYGLSWLSQQVPQAVVYWWQVLPDGHSARQGPVYGQRGQLQLSPYVGAPDDLCGMTPPVFAKDFPDLQQPMSWQVTQTHRQLHLPVVSSLTDRLIGWWTLEWPFAQAIAAPAQCQQLLQGHQLLADVLSQALILEQACMLASVDELTGLVNRRGFYQRFELELERSRRSGQPLCVALVDVDHFKVLNDTYGHLVGDDILQQLTRMMLQKLRRTDLVSRFGGEEFALLLPEVSQEHAIELLERLRESIAAFWFKAQHGETGDRPLLHATISIGFVLVTMTEGHDTPDGWTPVISQTLERVDRNLYQAKSQGRNQTVGHTLHLGEMPSVAQPV